MGRRRELSPPAGPVPARIDRLDARGVGHGATDDGAPVEVRGAAPGERIEVVVEHVGRRGTLFGRVGRVLEPSPDRIDAKCPHFLDCGGCDLLHLSDEAQHRLHQAWVAEALGRPVSDVSPVRASPRSLGYRALAKLVVGPGRVLGSYRPRSHDVQDMAGCVVHAPEAERIVDAARMYLRSVSAELDLRYLLVRASLHEGRAVVTLVSHAEDPAGVPGLARALFSRRDVARVVHHVNPSDGDALWGPGPTRVLHDEGAVEERTGPVRQSVEAQAFLQVNPGAAEVLYATAVEGARPEGLRALDLYAGSGGVGLALLAAGAASVTAVESVPSAVTAAQAAAATMGVADRFTARAGDTQAVLQELEGEFDVVVLNPPRKGASPEVLEAVAARSPARVVYVSCNPATLARDVRILETAGYAVTSITPVELFPQTRHVETVLVAERAPDAHG